MQAQAIRLLETMFPSSFDSLFNRLDLYKTRQGASGAACSLKTISTAFLLILRSSVHGSHWKAVGSKQEKAAKKRESAFTSV